MTVRSAKACLVVLAFVFGTQAARAQNDVQERLKRLEDMVQRLTSENQELRSTVEELKTQQEESEGGELQSRLDELEAAVEGIDLRSSLGGNRLFAQQGGFLDQVYFSGEWRTRFDVRSNTADLLDTLDDDGFRLDYRFNLGFGFRFAPIAQEGGPDLRITTHFEIQSVGRGANNTAENIESSIGTAIGDFATRENDLDVVRLYQAYILLENVFGSQGLDFKFGRQELAFGSFFVLGTNEFFTGTVHDAIRMDFDIDAIDGQFHLFYAKEAAADGQVSPTISTGGLLTAQVRASGDEDEMLGLYSEFSFADPIDIDLYYIYFNARSTNPAFVRPDNVTSPTDPAIDSFGRNILAGQIHTLGTWLRGDVIDDLWLSLEVAYQLGQDEAHNDLDALAIEFNGEWSLPFIETGKLYFGYYFAEGPDSGLDVGFSPLFISRHNVDPIRGHGAFSRLGNIDMIPTQNIHVVQVGFKFEPYESWTLGLTYLYSWLNHSRERLTINSLGNVFVDDRSFGHEVDLYARYTLNAQSDLFLNFSFFVPDADFFIEPAAAPGSFSKENTDVAIGAYVQIQVRF